MYSSMMLFISSTCGIRIKCFIICFHPLVIVAFIVSHCGHHYFLFIASCFTTSLGFFEGIAIMCQTVLFHSKFIALMLKVLKNIIVLVMLKKMFFI